MTEPSKVIHVRNVGHEISEVPSLSLSVSVGCLLGWFAHVLFWYYDYVIALLSYDSIALQRVW